MNNRDIFLTAASDLMGLIGWMLAGYVVCYIIYSIWLVRNQHMLTRTHLDKPARHEHVNRECSEED